MRMPTLLTLPPSRFLLRLVSIDSLALGMGFVLHGDPSAYTGEGEPVTWLSFAHLLARAGWPASSSGCERTDVRRSAVGATHVGSGCSSPSVFFFWPLMRWPVCTSRSTARRTGFSDCKRLRFPTVSTT